MTKFRFGIIIEYIPNWNYKINKEIIMSRESQIITATLWGAEKTIQQYESFGWELLSLNGNQITMSRETQNPVYSQLIKYQARYEDKMAEYNSIKNPAAPAAPAKPPKFRFKTAFWLFVALVIPCIAYITYKVLEWKKYQEALAAHENALVAHKAEIEKCDARRKAILAEIDQITMDSRATFFSQQG